jgi:hypothetical protein
MSGDAPVRFCERLGVRFPRATHPLVARLLARPRCEGATGAEPPFNTGMGEEIGHPTSKVFDSASTLPQP